ncbi:procathepsin L [Caerostris extrusa]|uniref:Procathepsin L n=1 Tax=Caerostris extrusa TaxID=172846 RepID=A0AAV4M868_CAEEX|nr:procathepsin L [Caerostris extrusa]
MSHREFLFALTGQLVLCNECRFFPNQQQCGSCWAFSTTGSLEGQHKLKTGKLVSLSEQNLVDCSGPEGNMGCEGGLMDQGFEYIIKNGGIDTEQSYPYTLLKTAPATSRRPPLAPPAKGSSTSPPVTKRPYSRPWPLGGIYDEPACDSQMLDHGVLAVGYGTEDGVDYWLVKNR